MKPFIVVGDKTTHGGTVITGDPTFTADGKPVARVKDLTVCPRCKGIFPIKSGADALISMGQPPALHMDETECGARLIASQGVSGYGCEGASNTAASERAASAAASSSLVAAEAPTICLECLIKAAASGSALVIRE